MYQYITDCRGTSLIRNSALLGPYRRPMPRVIGGSWGGGCFLTSEVPLYPSKGTARDLDQALILSTRPTGVLEILTPPTPTHVLVEPVFTATVPEGTAVYPVVSFRYLGKMAMSNPAPNPT